MKDLKQTKLNELVDQCRSQTQLYTQREEYDPQFCFELWRRAIVERNEDAWQAITEQYTLSVRRWLTQRLANLPALQVEEDVLVNTVFINFFRFVGPDKFVSFPTLPALLRYLKLCCGTIVIDLQRDQQGRQLDTSLDAPVSSGTEQGQNLGTRLPSEFDLEETATQRADRPGFWTSVWEKLPDPTDKMLVYLRYVQDIPPREIVQQYPQHFTDINQVYRRNKNILWRLRNSSLK